MRQYYKSELGMGTDYVSLLPKNLTIRRNFSAKRFDKRGITVFKEVSVLPFSEALSMWGELFYTMIDRKENKEQLLERARSRLAREIFDSWIPNCSHLVLHSSGLDSRMISWTIKELHKKYGDKWLGNVVFVCSKWESSEFKKIMQYEGWNESQYLCPYEELGPTDYYKYSLLDFENAWKFSNGISAIPVNLFWYLGSRAKELGMLPGKVQTFYGQWGNTVMDETSNDDIKKKIEMFYYSVLFARPIFGDETILPFLNPMYIAAISSSSVKLGKELRFELLKSMDSRLAEFVNLRSDGDRHRKISDEIINQMITDYDSSWYGKNIQPGKRPKHKTTEFQDFWSYWTTASLCEYLLRSGYKIT